MDEVIETLLHATYAGLVALESDHTYRWAAAGLFCLSALHLWRHRRDYCQRALAPKWFGKRE